MTLIIGIDKEIDGKRVQIMAGDKAGSNGFTKENNTKAKVFSRGKYAFGFTTSFRMGQLLEHATLSNDLPDWGKESNLYVSFVQWVRDTLKEGGYATITSNEESGGTFIFHNGVSLYRVQDDFSILQHSDGLFAVGSGSYHALAIMKNYFYMVKDKKVEFDLNYLVKNVFKVVNETVTTVSKEHTMIDLTKLT